MAIKRFTVEFDDSTDGQKATASPLVKAEQDYSESKKQELTSPGQYGYEEDTESSQEVSAPQVTTGRTFPDLISEFVNNPRAMATTLMFVPFIIFVAKIDSLEALKYPVITGLILNFVWFGIPAINNIYRWLFKKT